MIMKQLKSNKYEGLKEDLNQNHIFELIVIWPILILSLLSPDKFRFLESRMIEFMIFNNNKIFHITIINNANASHADWTEINQKQDCN